MAQVCKSCEQTEFDIDGDQRVCSNCGEVQEESAVVNDDKVEEHDEQQGNPEKDQTRDIDTEDEEEKKDQEGKKGDEDDDDEDSDVEYQRKNKKTIEEDDSDDSDDDEPGDKKNVEEVNKDTEDSDESKDSEDSDEESDEEIAKKDDKDGDGESDESGDNDDEDEVVGGEDEVAGDDEDEDDDEQSKKISNETVYDFDIMMAKKKAENSRKRRRRGYDIIDANDDDIVKIIEQMEKAREADNLANDAKQVATNKLKLLPFIVDQLRKIDLREAFLDSDVLSVIRQWLEPLPDKSLPHLTIRENLLKILIDFNLYDVDRIKGSGIGKAVMYLYKHPKETKENKQRAKQLISAWSRPIFNLDSSFSAISREEREERDKELKRRASRTVDSSDEESSSQAPKRVKDTAQPVAKNPGDKGWIPRARVPAPSMRDYVIRPRSKVDGDIGKGSKRPANMLEKLMKTHQERRRANKQQRAINMKIDKL